MGLNRGYDPNDIMEVSTQELAYKQVMARMGADEGMLTGMHHAELSHFMDQMTQQLVLELRAMVLSSDGGDEQVFEESHTTFFCYMAPRRPWWISKRRWAKWECDVIEIPRTVTVLARVKPEYTYPDCSKVFPPNERVIRVANLKHSMRVEDYRPASKPYQTPAQIYQAEQDARREEEGRLAGWLWREETKGLRGDGNG